MARPQSRFVCQSCGEAFLRWEGQCRACDGWNTLVETVVREPTRSERAIVRGPTMAAAPEPLAGIAEADLPRLRLGIGELDRVLGGGLVPGSLVLVGGEPGIGKSTLLLQAAAGLARRGRRWHGPLRDRRGIAGPGPAPRRAARAAERAGGRAGPRPGRARRRADRRDRAGRATRPGRRRFDPDGHRRRPRRRGRERRPGPRIDAPPDGPGQGRRDRGHPRRPRDQGRLDRRARRPSSTWSMPS